MSGKLTTDRPKILNNFLQVKLLDKNVAIIKELSQKSTILSCTNLKIFGKQ